jgi:hypothetical protein
MSTARELLAVALKKARLDAGFTTHGKLATVMVMSRSVVVKGESGTQTVPSDPVLLAWANATGADLQELFELAKRARSGTPEWFMPYLAAEQAATRLRFWGPTVPPGLLQTENYARALMKSDASVARQMERQSVIGRVQVTAVIDHRVLVHAIGSPAIMAEQCRQLAELVESEKIRLHVVPEGANVGLGGAFAIASNKGLVTVSMATTTRDITSTAADMVEETLAAFDLILGTALPPVPSVEFVRQMEETWKEHS